MTLQEQLKLAKVELNEAKYSKIKADQAARRTTAYYHEAAARVARLEVAIEEEEEKA